MHVFPNPVWKILICVYAKTPCTEKVHITMKLDDVSLLVSISKNIYIYLTQENIIL